MACGPNVLTVQLAAVSAGALAPRVAEKWARRPVATAFIRRIWRCGPLVTWTPGFLKSAAVVESYLNLEGRARGSPPNKRRWGIKGCHPMPVSLDNWQRRSPGEETWRRWACVERGRPCPSGPVSFFRHAHGRYIIRHGRQEQEDEATQRRQLSATRGQWRGYRGCKEYIR